MTRVDLQNRHDIYTCAPSKRARRNDESRLLGRTAIVTQMSHSSHGQPKNTMHCILSAAAHGWLLNSNKT